VNSLYIKNIKFCYIKENIDSNILKPGHPLKIELVYNEDQNVPSVTDKRKFSKTFYQLNTWC